MHFSAMKMILSLSCAAAILNSCRSANGSKTLDNTPDAKNAAPKAFGFHYPESDENGWGACKGELQSPVRLSRGQFSLENEKNRKFSLQALNLKTMTARAKLEVFHGSARVSFPDADSQRENGAGVIYINDEVYYLKQFHFHTPAEHKIDNEEHAMEMHFVFMNQKITGSFRNFKAKAIALGFMFKQGAEHEGLKQLTSHLSASTHGHAAPPAVEMAINPGDFMPKDLSAMFWSYEGSLTTPHCDEIVNHIVYAKDLTASAAQISAMSMGSHVGTARPYREVDTSDPRRDFKNIKVHVFDRRP